MDTKIHEIDINGHKIKCAYSGEIFYRAGKSGFDIEKLMRELKEFFPDQKEDADNSDENTPKKFSLRDCQKLYITVDLLWLMLVEESCEQFKTPSELARIFIPVPPAEVFSRIGAVFRDGTAAAQPGVK